MLLGILPASFILAAIRVSFENMSMKEYPDLQDSSLLTLWSEKQNYFLENVRVLVFFMCKNVGCFLCAGEGPQPDPFFMGIQCIFLTLSFFVRQLRSSFTKKSICCGKYICLGT